jgi:uncharacterized protein YjdB
MRKFRRICTAVGVTLKYSPGKAGSIFILLLFRRIIMKKHFWQFAAVLAAITLAVIVAGCGGDKKDIPVTSVTLSDASKSLVVGRDDDGFTLTATVLPANASRRNVTWSVTGDTGAVELVGTGASITVKPKAGGTAKIKAIADGRSSDECVVKVTAAGDYEPVTGVSLDQYTKELKETMPFTITATLEPENATIQGVTWAVKEGAGFIEELEPDGLTVKVTGKAEGTAVVKVTTEDGGIEKECTITVIPFTGEHVTGVTLNVEEETLAIGGTFDLTATVEPSDAGEKGVTWSLDRDDIVELSADTGETVTVTAKALGTAVVTVTTEDRGFTADAVITVSGVTTAKDPEAKDFTFGNLTQAVGKVSAVTITPKTGSSEGQITIYYTGIESTSYTRSTVEPALAGKYAVTFDVAEATGWNAAADLSAGTLTISLLFTDVTDFDTWLGTQAANSKEAPYYIALKVDDLGGNSSTSGSLGAVLKANSNKFVYLDLSGSNFANIESQALRECVTLVGIILPDELESIGTEAFRSSYNIGEVIIPASVTDISSDAFTNCGGIRAFRVDEENAVYCSVDGILYSKNKTKLIFYAYGNGLKSFEVPSHVTSIEFLSFYDCTLESLIISSPLTIEKEAFNNCSKLENVTICSGTIIKDKAFQACWSLRSVTFEAGIAAGDFGSDSPFPGDLRTVFYATDSTNGTPGTYTTTDAATWVLEG